MKVISAVTVSSSATTIDTFSTNTDAAAHYIIIGSAGDGKSIMEATVISDGTEASVSEGPQVSTKGQHSWNLSASHSSHNNHSTGIINIRWINHGQRIQDTHT